MGRVFVSHGECFTAAEFEKFVRIVLFPDTFSQFVLSNTLTINFGACDKFTTGRTVDLHRECNSNDHAFRFATLAPGRLYKGTKGTMESKILGVG